MRIGVDLMGSDSSPLVLFQAVIDASMQLGREIVMVVFATQPIIDQIKLNPKWTQHLAPSFSSIEFRVVQEVIDMRDEPLMAIRKKKGSSIVVGMKQLKKQQLHGFVSAGNTGALVAYSNLFLPKLPGIKRAALLAVLPTAKGSVAVIDVGGNVSCKAEHLLQFAQMGAAYQRCANQIELPYVGLLNIGAESSKGTAILKEVYQKLENLSSESSHMRFIGNIEGAQVFHGNIHVLVTDGFTGNVFLKTSEGVSSFVLKMLEKSLTPGLKNSLGAELKQLGKKFNHEEYPGAVICGINSVVVKCHGHSSETGMLNAIKGACNLIQGSFLEKLKEELCV